METDQIGEKIESLEMGWVSKVGRPDVFFVAVTGRPSNDPHPILKDIFEVLNSNGHDKVERENSPVSEQVKNERDLKLVALRKRYPQFSDAIRRLHLNMAIGKLAKLAWDGQHKFRFELE